MDENNTNESSRETTKPAKGFFATLAELHDETKYPKKPTPKIIYVVSVIVGCTLTILTSQCIAYIVAILDDNYVMDFPVLFLVPVIFFCGIPVYSWQSASVLSDMEFVLRCRFFCLSQ